MEASVVISYIFLSIATLAAIAIILTKSLFKAALYLMIVLLSVAGLYVLSFAEFLAVTQILIYAGGIVVVLIFGIMLSTKISGKPLQIDNTNIFLAVLLGVGLIVSLLPALQKAFTNSQVNNIAINSVKQTGINILSSHLLAFEIAGILLLVALIGAAVISTTETKADPNQ
jgi:NADH:ubiquinone oxidoreductase subunit 6 (subunit J)